MEMVAETLDHTFCNAGTEYCIWYKPYKFNKNSVKGLGHHLEYRVVGWRSPSGKLLDLFFRKPDERSKVTNFPTATKLRNKETGKRYCPAEGNPLVRTMSHQIPHLDPQSNVYTSFWGNSKAVLRRW
jgi:hypothetical protein